MEKSTKLLLVYWLGLGLLCMSWLILIPKESASSGFMGLSLLRWGVILPILLGTSIGAVGIALHHKSLFSQHNFNQKKLNLSLFISTLGFIICTIFFTDITFTITNQQIKGVLYRTLPLVIWWGGISLLFFILSTKALISQNKTNIKDKIFQAGYVILSKKNEILALLILIIVLSALFIPVYKAVSYIPGSDFMAHARQAERIDRMKRLDTSYFLYQLYLIFGHRLFPQSTYLDIGIGVVSFFSVLLGVILFILLLMNVKPLSQNKLLHYVLLLLLTISLCTAAPASLFTIQKKNLYFGYLGITIYHNPTLIILKPFALILLLFTLNSFYHSCNSKFTIPKQPQFISIFITAAVTIIGILAKPNFIITLLPAVALVFIFYILIKKPMNTYRIIFGITLPSILLLSWQYFATYTQESIITDKSNIVFAPFLVYSREYDLLFFKFFLSILFPLLVYIIYFPQAKKDFALNFSWLVFGFGALYTYFFAETGERLQDANFGWSGDITNFILFVFSTFFFLQQWTSTHDFHENNSYKTFLPWVAFSMHIISGIFWYYSHLYHPFQPWW